MLKILLQLLLPQRRYVLSIGSNKNLIRFTHILYKIFPHKMKSVIIIMAGGTAPDIIAEDDVLIKEFKKYKKIFVESTIKTKLLQDVGLENAGFYPNARLRPRKEYARMYSQENFKCVFYSRITVDKGAELAIEAIKRIRDEGFPVTLDFWGPIEKDYEKLFLSRIEKERGINYRGVFDSQTGDVYELLSQYQVMLLLTRCKTEGVPGALIESVIAGTPVIATNWNVNPEIIEDGYNGYLIQIDDIEELVRKIKLLCMSKDLQHELSINTRKSSEKFYFENYMDELVKIIC